jgi:hypothetical protein
VNVLKPAIGSEEIGFSSHVGDFDTLVDTINNEMRFNNPIMDDDDDDDEYHNFGMGGSTLDLLKSQHNCHRYVVASQHDYLLFGMMDRLIHLFFCFAFC